MILFFAVCFCIAGYIVLWRIMYAFRSPMYDEMHKRDPANYPAPSDFAVPVGCFWTVVATVVLLIAIASY